MRRLITALLCLAFLTAEGHAQKQISLRVEVASTIVTRTFRIGFDHQISEHWSMGAESGIRFGKFLNGKDNETLTHWHTLSGTGEAKSDRKFQEWFTEASLLVRYWPQEVYRGPVLCMGGAMRDRRGPDVIAGVGYTLTVWKGLRIDLMYILHIMEAIDTSGFSIDNIRIGICYVF